MLVFNVFNRPNGFLQSLYRSQHIVLTNTENPHIWQILCFLEPQTPKYGHQSFWSLESECVVVPVHVMIDYWNHVLQVKELRAIRMRSRCNRSTQTAHDTDPEITLN